MARLPNPVYARQYLSTREIKELGLEQEVLDAEHRRIAQAEHEQSRQKPEK